MTQVVSPNTGYRIYKFRFQPMECDVFQTHFNLTEEEIQRRVSKFNEICARKTNDFDWVYFYEVFHARTY